ncbi:N-acetyltransferase ESCO2 [Harmonia axyridis]|uniref:N-acetyltransferase ESCO2 n=1 Tax=Harmonia axyridis TaxID=115357 RepID=UPI001E275AD3|nr:N-acetyltransferase ESCO2 [Harmonia axyridis]
MNEINMDEPNANSPNKHEYSSKIGQRRRALFPEDEPQIMTADANPLGMSPCRFEYQNISRIRSTSLIGMILDSPQKKLTIDNADTSPCKNTKEDDSISFSTLSAILKTPNDSNTYSKEAPKISRRKSVGASSDKEDVSCNKTSKVRTSLFQDIGMTLSTEKFYSSKNSDLIKKKLISPSLSRFKKLDKPKQTKNQQKKIFFGQINAGVKHKIKKKIDKSPKVSKASVSHIKTYKSDLVVKSKFDEFLKDLDEINENKKVKLIQMPQKDQTTSEKNTENTLKRSHDNTEELSSIVENTENTLKRSLDDTEKVPSKKFKSSESNSVNPYVDTDFEVLEEEITVPIESILDRLDDSVEENKENQSRDKEGILSPTSVLTNMTLGLKLCSPKKVRNLTSVFQKMADANTQAGPSQSTQSQYYPIFYPQKKICEKRLEKESIVKRKKMKVSSDQMLLDAGQKKFGLTQCTECNYVYNAGDPDDENLHDNHHNARYILQFNGWKNERIVAKNEGRIIQILPGDGKHWTDKVELVLQFINRQMGYYNMDVDTSRSMVFLYIFNKQIIGCLTAEAKTTANKLLTASVEVDLCSMEEYPITCGVSRIWVLPTYQKKGIATAMMEALRKNFLPNRMLEKCEIALSAPTPDGKLFGTKYFETENFYTYLN